MNTISRKDAARAGLTRYYTGQPCRHGHVSERKVCDGGCVLCKSAQRSASWHSGGYAKNVDRRSYHKRKADIQAKRAAVRRANPERVRARDRARYARNREAEVDKAKRWRKANPGKVAALHASYAGRHPEKYRDAARRRRAALAQAAGQFTHREWVEKCREYGNRCACCKMAKTLHADHIVPLSRGGSNCIQNIQPLCKSCNSRKGTTIMAYPADASNAIIRLA